MTKIKGFAGAPGYAAGIAADFATRASSTGRRPIPLWIAMGFVEIKARLGALLQGVGL